MLSYLDSTGVEVGPFPPVLMCVWLAQGFSSIDLPVRPSHRKDFVPLGALMLSTPHNRYVHLLPCLGELPVLLGELLGYGAIEPSPAKTLSAKTAMTVSAKTARKRHAARFRRAVERALEAR